MFAIQWALLVCNIISSLTVIPPVIFDVKSEKFHESIGRFFDKMPSDQDMPLLKLMMKFQFGALLFVYLLGIFAAVYAPATVVGYVFGAGNFLRVLYIVYFKSDAERFAMSGFGNMMNTILIVQSVLGCIIIACTYISSGNAEYQAFAADMAASAEAKWDTDRSYIYYILGVHGFFTLTGLPGLFAPAMAIKQYITVESKMPTDKMGQIILEFTMGFQQLAVLMIQIFGVVVLWYAPSIDVIAIFWQPTGLFFVVTIFIHNILKAEEYGFERMPMLVFLILNTYTMGVSAAALMY